VRRRKNISCLRRHACVFLLLAAPAAARAQALPGIDLTDDERKQEERPPVPPPAAPRPAVATTPPEGGVLGPALGAPGERDAALADRVKAVQRKGFLKRNRVELTLDLPATLNDAFYQKAGLGGRLAWNLHDSFALGVRGAWWWTLRTDHLREGQAAFQSQLLSSQPVAQLMLDGIWSPIYGKASWLGSRIVHFDLFLLGGVGAVWSDTSLAPRSEGAHPAADLGAGMRFYPADWLALELGFTATLYPDRPTPTSPSTAARILAAHVGITFFYPFGFEYVYP
jgi:outer membrane beta-barrel protein